ncbi:phosphatidate cytidylyltransferase [Bacteroidia bacterium]|nr:phosphatidate cytidylyltransferase [Bacteroidia bacterium]
MANKMGAELNQRPSYCCGVALFISGFLHNNSNTGSGYIYILFFTAVFVLIISEIYKKKKAPFKNLAFSIFGIFYISLPLTLLTYFPNLVHHSGEVAEGAIRPWKPEIIFLPFLLVWLNDTFAYLCGVTMGRHKLFPRISPKKSWEGAIGGGIVTIAVALLLPYYEVWQIEGLTITDYAAIAAIAVVFGIFGDLFESMLKRNVDIKDSGTIMPGHGGILDRLDAVLLVIPAVFAYLLLVHV